MNPTIEKMEQLRKQGYKLDFGEVLEQTFVNYKKIALISGLVVLLLFFIFFAAILGLSLLYNDINSFTQTLTGFEPGSVSTTKLIANMIITVISSAIMAPLSAGLLKIAHLAHLNKEISFSTAFDYYRSKYVKNLLVATALIAFTSQAITTLFNLLTSYDKSNEVLFNTIAISIGLIISLVTYLTIPLIIFGNLSVLEAITSSIQLVLKKFWIILFLLIVCIICIFFGLIAICIGIAFTLPLLYSLQYTIYNSIVPIQEKDELDEIGSYNDSQIQ